MVDNKLEPVRSFAPTASRRTKELVVSGEIGGRAKAPAYAHDP